MIQTGAAQWSPWERSALELGVWQHRAAGSSCGSIEGAAFAGYTITGRTVCGGIRHVLASLAGPELNNCSKHRTVEKTSLCLLLACCAQLVEIGIPEMPSAGMGYGVSRPSFPFR